MKHRILLVEDQKEIRDVVLKYLQHEGYDCTIAKDGFEAMELFNDNNYHLILLDVMMPGIDGFEVLKEVRTISDIPVIMLTARQEEVDRLKGFDYGADDYVVKPFSPRELIRRIKALLKRVYRESEDKALEYENLRLNLDSQKLYKGEDEIDITAVEFEVLRVFFNNIGHVLSREQIIQKAFGHNYEGYDRNVDTYIKRIRQKIEADPRHPEYIKTKYRAGYIFGGN